METDPPPRPWSPMVDAGTREPRLLDRVRLAVRSRHYSLRTEEAYVAWVRRFVIFHAKHLGHGDDRCQVASECHLPRIPSPPERRGFWSIFLGSLESKTSRMDRCVFERSPGKDTSG